MSAFIKGFFMPLVAFRFMAHNRRLIKFAVFPFIINVFVFTAGAIIAWSYYLDWLRDMLPAGNDAWYWAVVQAFLAVVFGIVVILFIVVLFTLIGSVIASPFNDMLSERTEKILKSVPEEEKFSLKMLAGDAARSVGQEVKKLSFFAVLFGGIFILNFLPGIGNILYLVLNIICTFCILALEFIDFPLSRRRISFRAKIAFVRRQFFPVLGFGAALFTIGLVMFLNYLLLPVAVVGGTLLYCDLEESRRGTKG